MDIVGLISGGKDSCYNLICATRRGHRIVALANLCPEVPKELDSYMYQTVGSEGVELYSEAMGVPLYRKVINGLPVNQTSEYTRTQGDEVEDLYELLKEIKEKHPSLQGVSAGAVLSSYQKQRVEEVCKRLDLTPLCYLWERDQAVLLREMIENGIHAIIIKVAAIGLNQNNLGMTLEQIEPIMLKLQSKYGVHPCGEGGEYESFVLNCSLFKKRIHLLQSEIIHHDQNEVSPVCYLRLSKLCLAEK